MAKLKTIFCFREGTQVCCCLIAVPLSCFVREAKNNALLFVVIFGCCCFLLLLLWRIDELCYATQLECGEQLGKIRYMIYVFYSGFEC
jgi:hypothetical protein